MKSLSEGWQTKTWATPVIRLLLAFSVILLIFGLFKKEVALPWQVSIGLVIFLLSLPLLLWALVNRVHRVEAFYKEGFKKISESQNNLMNVLQQEFSLRTTEIQETFANQALAFRSFPKLLDETKYEISIAGISLEPLIRDLEFKKAIEKAVDRGCQIRIAILDPDASITRYIRSAHTPNYSDLSPERTISILRAWQREPQFSTISVRLFDAYPVVSLLLTEDVGVFSPYLTAKTLLDHPAIQLDGRSGGFHRHLRHYFDEIWALAKTIE